MRERELRGVRKVAHGRGRWHLNGLGLHEEYTDLVPLMRALSARLALSLEGKSEAPFRPLGDPAAEVPPELPHLARRFSPEQRTRRPQRVVRRGALGERAELEKTGKPLRASPGPVGSRHR